jgi:hypothetical protein
MVKSAWFAAIHDIVLTNDRLVVIRLTMYGRAPYLELGTNENRDDTSNGPQAHTTRLANATRLPVLASTTAGGALMDHRPLGLLPITVQ